jgi:2-dehydropantoate 2-reductase
MRVLIMGAGAVGGYCGAALARGGHDVVLVARGAHLAALQQSGIAVRRRGETVVTRPIRAVASPSDAGMQPELVLFSVKGYDTDGAIAALQPVVNAKCAILSVQNGIDGVDRLTSVFGAERVLPGTIMIWSTIASPGVVEETGPYCRLTFGEQTGVVTPRVEAIAAACTAVGLEATISADARLAVWQKFIALAPHATITSLCEAPIGPICATTEGMALYRTLISEVIAVGRAAGVALPADALEATLAVVQSIPASSETSMQHDFQRRHRVELDIVTGAVVRRGGALGVPVPAFTALYAVLKVRALAFGGLGNP